MQPSPDGTRLTARAQAIEALPEELQEDARRKDVTVIPVTRRVFTETAPIKDFQAKLKASYVVE